MNSLFSLFSFFFALLPALPVVKVSDFQPGKSWSWNYYETGSGRLHATEKYSVLAIKKSAVLIEMSTQYDGVGDFIPHHRILVPVEACLKAYENPFDYRPWSFTMEHFADGRWNQMGIISNTLAFEEKFNCNPFHMEGSNRYKNEFSVIDGESVFRLLWLRKHPSSWFFLSGENAAIAAQKDFSGRYYFQFSGSEDLKHTYQF